MSVCLFNEPIYFPMLVFHKDNTSLSCCLCSLDIFLKEGAGIRGVLWKRFYTPGEGLPLKNIRGTRRKFWKEPLRAIKILFSESCLEFFSLLRGANFKTTHYLLSCII